MMYLRKAHCKVRHLVLKLCFKHSLDELKLVPHHSEITSFLNKLPGNCHPSSVSVLAAWLAESL